MRVDVDPPTSQLQFRWAARYGRPGLPVRVWVSTCTCIHVHVLLLSHRVAGMFAI